ncbi:hypothetical protein DsansV1_C19g0157821 [Dioscorea sansibarensis]
MSVILMMVIYIYIYIYRCTVDASSSTNTVRPVHPSNVLMARSSINWKYFFRASTDSGSAISLRNRLCSSPDVVNKLCGPRTCFPV